MIRFTALPTDIVLAYRDGAPDTLSNPLERHVSDGDGNPRRHCLCHAAKGAGVLVLSTNLSWAFIRMLRLAHPSVRCRLHPGLRGGRARYPDDLTQLSGQGLCSG